MSTQIKCCRDCNEILVVGENWGNARAKKNDYICKGCRTKRQQAKKILGNPNFKPLLNSASKKIKVCIKCFSNLCVGDNISSVRMENSQYLCDNCYEEKLKIYNKTFLLSDIIKNDICNLASLGFETKNIATMCNLHSIVVNNVIRENNIDHIWKVGKYKCQPKMKELRLVK